MTMGQGEHFLVRPFISQHHRMVNKSVRCATKAAEKAAMRLCSASTAEAATSEAADVSAWAASTTQPVAVTAAGTRNGSGTQDDYELGVVYSGESDPESDSKETHVAEEPEPSIPETARSDSDNALTRARRLDLFGSSD